MKYNRLPLVKVHFISILTDNCRLFMRYICVFDGKCIQGRDYIRVAWFFFCLIRQRISIVRSSSNISVGSIRSSFLLVSIRRHTVTLDHQPYTWQPATRLPYPLATATGPPSCHLSGPAHPQAATGPPPPQPVLPLLQPILFLSTANPFLFLVNIETLISAPPLAALCVLWWLRPVW